MDKKQVLKLRLDGMTYQQIGSMFSVSRQRIQQILSPPPEIKQVIQDRFEGKCAICGILVGGKGHLHHRNNNGMEHYQDVDNLQLLCISCHRREHKKPPKYFCPQCGRPIRGEGFCSWECHREYCKISHKCSECGRVFTVPHPSELRARISLSKSKLIFCSKKCQGRWLGKNYGRYHGSGNFKRSRRFLFWNIK